MEKQGLNELAAAVHENAVAHGWWDQERELPEILMLCVSELAEALEEYRAGKPNIYYNVEGEEILYADGEACEKHERRKPEGVAVELADCMIRILDYCGHAGIDIEEAIRIKHEYNKTRPYRHKRGQSLNRKARRATMIRTQRHSRFVLMSLDEIRATRDIVLQTEETKSNFSGSGKTVYICEVVRPCDYQKETDTAADKLAAEIERVNADNRALRRKIERLERELQKARAGE